MPQQRKTVLPGGSPWKFWSICWTTALSAMLFWAAVARTAAEMFIASIALAPGLTHPCCFFLWPTIYGATSDDTPDTGSGSIAPSTNGFTPKEAA